MPPEWNLALIYVKSDKKIGSVILLFYRALFVVAPPRIEAGPQGFSISLYMIFTEIYNKLFTNKFSVFNQFLIYQKILLDIEQAGKIVC
jgi:hypothetical protein